VRIEKGIVNNGSISGSTGGTPSQRSLSNSNLQNSLSVPNFNDLHSDDEECDVSMSISGISGDGRLSRGGLNHLSPYKPRNPLYMSTEQLNESSKPSMVRTTAHFLLESSRSSLSAQHLKSSNPPPPTETTASGRDLHHQQEQLSGENDFYHNNLSRSMSSLAMTPSSSRSKQRREELTKAVSEARKKLQSLGWKSSGNNSLSSSKSVTDLRFRNSHPPSTNSATSGFYTSSSYSSSSVPRSISMSDLSFGPSRRLLDRQQQLQNQREGIDIPISAPVWDNHKSTENLSAVGLKKSTSITSLAKREKRAGKTQGWGLPTPLSLGGMRSGRASAPPARPGGRLLRLPNGGSIPGTQSSDDESTTDEESSSSYVRTNLLRPGTPPKPSLLRQVRRSSTSHVFSPNSPFGGTLSSKCGLMANNNNIPHQGTLARSRSRKLWDNNFELRSSKSEYNLNFMGRDSGISRSGSRVNLSSSFWENNRIDFQSSNPATIELTRESCEQVIEELNFMAIFVRKMFKRTQSNPATQGLAEFLADGVVKTINTLSAVVPLPMASTSSPRLLQPHLHHHLLQQQQQQLLMSQKSPIHHNMRHQQQQQQNVLSPSSNSSSGGPANPPVPMNLLVQYSDALLSLMQQRMRHQQQTNISTTTNPVQKEEKVRLLIFDIF